jgi:hypothetical protein
MNNFLPPSWKNFAWTRTGPLNFTASQLEQGGTDVERIAALTGAGRRDRVVSGMNIAIAMAQFIMVALGVMASRILVNSGAIPDAGTAWSDRLAVFASSQGVWLLLIPAGWFILASLCSVFRPALIGPAQSFGVALAVSLLAVIVAMFVF